jgi:hypothetical protein
MIDTFANITQYNTRLPRAVRFYPPTLAIIPWFREHI